MSSSTNTLQNVAPANKYLNAAATETVPLFDYLEFGFPLEYDVFAPARWGRRRVYKPLVYSGIKNIIGYKFYIPISAVVTPLPDFFLVTLYSKVHMLEWIRKLVQRHPVWAFVVVTFVWSFGIDTAVYAIQGPSPSLLFKLPRIWGPLVGGVVVTYLLGDSVRAWFGQVFNWRVSPLLYVLAVVLPILLGEADALLQAAVGLPVTFSPPPLMSLVISLGVMLFLAGSLEEFGWRGFAQPRLQESYSATLSAAGIGVAWGLWHLPFFVLFDNGAFNSASFHWYMLGIVSMSVVLGWLYNESGGSVLLPMITHAVHNQGGLFETTADLSGAVARASAAAPSVAEAIVGACIVLACGYRFLCRSKLDSTAIGIPGTDSSSS